MKSLKLKPNYFVIPLITVATAALGSFFTNIGMPWYDADLIKPALTPPSLAFPIAWTTIFILTTISVLIIWNKSKRDKVFGWLIALFILNAFLNAAWCLLFFTLRDIQGALIEMILLEGTTIGIMAVTWKKSKLASLLLAPYLVWVGFATYLTYMILSLNS